MQLILSFDNEEDFELAKVALEKRIPGKPVYYDTKFRQCGPRYGELVTLERAYDCPCCKRTFGRETNMTFCPGCGQALDWGDVQ